MNPLARWWSWWKETLTPGDPNHMPSDDDIFLGLIAFLLGILGLVGVLFAWMPLAGELTALSMWLFLALAYTAGLFYLLSLSRPTGWKTVLSSLMVIGLISWWGVHVYTQLNDIVTRTGLRAGAELLNTLTQEGPIIPFREGALPLSEGSALFVQFASRMGLKSLVRLSSAQHLTVSGLLGVGLLLFWRAQTWKRDWKLTGEGILLGILGGLIAILAWPGLFHGLIFIGAGLAAMASQLGGPTTALIVIAGALPATWRLWDQVLESGQKGATWLAQQAGEKLYRGWRWLNRQNLNTWRTTSDLPGWLIGWFDRPIIWYLLIRQPDLTLGQRKHLRRWARKPGNAKALGRYLRWARRQSYASFVEALEKRGDDRILFCRTLGSKGDAFTRNFRQLAQRNSPLALRIVKRLGGPDHKRIRPEHLSYLLKQAPADLRADILREIGGSNPSKASSGQRVGVGGEPLTP